MTIASILANVALALLSAYLHQRHSKLATHLKRRGLGHVLEELKAGVDEVVQKKRKK